MFANRSDWAKRTRLALLTRARSHSAGVRNGFGRTSRAGRSICKRMHRSVGNARLRENRRCGGVDLVKAGAVIRARPWRYLLYSLRLPQLSSPNAIQAVLTQEGIARALRGDKAVLRNLVDALTPTIQSRVARVLLRTGCQGRRGSVRQEVDDLTQEVFVRLFAREGRALRTWDQARGLTLPHYVGLVAEREVISMLRSKRRSLYTERPTEQAQLEASALPDETAEMSMLTRQLATVMCERLQHTLSPLGFRVFELLFREEHSPEAVCSELGMSADALYAWRSRIRKTARELVQELSPEGAP